MKTKANEALADILTAVAEGWTRSDGARIIEPAEHARMAQAASVLAAELGCLTGWREVAAAVRAEVTEPQLAPQLAPQPPLPELPDGWTEQQPSVDENRRVYFAEDSRGRLVFLTVYRDNTVEWSGLPAPRAVRVYLLARAQAAAPQLTELQPAAPKERGG